MKTTHNNHLVHKICFLLLKQTHTISKDTNTRMSSSASTSTTPTDTTTSPTEEMMMVKVRNLNFSYDNVPNLVGVHCEIPKGAKILLVGANGAGKSTLMRILTGQIWTGLTYDELSINGSTRTPNDQCNGVSYLGGTWKRRRTGFEGICPYTMDCAASEMMANWQAQHVERRDELVRVLGINLQWRMHECSDGQRKKVRMMIKLLKPFSFCVIDEFAADLDIFSRKRFFDYLTKECSERGASILYATHIFDQADEWATHITFMQLNKVLSDIHPLATYKPYQEILARTGKDRAMCPMYTLVFEELARQYKTQSDIEAFLWEDNDNDDVCLEDVIMEHQQTELAGDRFQTEQEGDQTGWVAGRLTRQLNQNAKEEARAARIEKRRFEEEGGTAAGVTAMMETEVEEKKEAE